MAKAFKDHFGNASAANERVLRTTEAKERFGSETQTHLLSLQEQEKICNEQAEKVKEQERQKREQERKEEEEPRMTGMLNREEWLRNKAIIDAKARGEYEKPSRKREVVVKVPKTVEIIEALYGLPDIKLIDITSKVVVGEKVNNDLAGEDPCPKKKKNVIVKAKVDGIEGEYTFIEGKKIVF